MGTVGSRREGVFSDVLPEWGLSEVGERGFSPMCYLNGDCRKWERGGFIRCVT